MKRPITHAHGLAALGLLALTAVATAAGQHAPLSDPADDRAPVPATRYEPLVTTSPAAAPTSSPSDNWKALNREVASFDSMSATMDMQGANSAQPEKPEQPMPAVRTKPTPGSDAEGSGAENPAAPSKKPSPHAGHAAAPAAKSGPHESQTSMRGMPGMPGMPAGPHTGHSGAPSAQPGTHEHQNMEHK
jgi:hypothetical protein